MLQAEFKIEKKHIARSFSQAAKSYDSHASLQRKVADNLLAQLSKNSKVQRVLDLGSGTGYCTNELHRLYPNADIINLDIAEAMLLFASNRQKETDFKQKSICADAEALPFINDSFDVVFSSLSIQWCQDYAVLFAELNRVLIPKGCFYISTFGPDTLQELKTAWQQVDPYIHVNHFQSDTVLKSHIHKKGFNEINVDIEELLTHYSSFEDLARELKSIGASNKNAGQIKGLSGRNKILKLKQLFENNSDHHLGIPVTYQVFYLIAKGL